MRHVYEVGEHGNPRGKLRDWKWFVVDGDEIVAMCRSKNDAECLVEAMTEWTERIVRENESRKEAC